MAIMRLGLNSLRIFSADFWQSLWTCRWESSSALRLQFQAAIEVVMKARNHNTLYSMRAAGACSLY